MSDLKPCLCRKGFDHFPYCPLYPAPAKPGEPVCGECFKPEREHPRYEYPCPAPAPKVDMGPCGLSEEEKAGIVTIKEMLAAVTPGQWDWSNFSKADGSLIVSVEDVAETLAVSARKGPGAYLKGVSAKDDQGDLVVCYTGNGPRAEANSRLLAHAPYAIRYLTGIIERLLSSTPPDPSKVPCEYCGSSWTGGSHLTPSCPNASPDPSSALQEKKS